MSRALVVSHPLAPTAQRLAGRVAAQLGTGGWEAVPIEDDDGGDFAAAVALGGDGTFLRAAERVRGRAIPILGVNVGHMGFLQQADVEDLDTALARLMAGDYTVERRATVRAEVTGPNGHKSQGWAVNEATLEKTMTQRMIEVEVLADGHPISTFGCDGVVCATPTGSTGHAFSGGGPIVWPQVDAMLVVPLAAHALFVRPLIVAPSTVVTIEILPTSRSEGEVSFDGRRSLPVPVGGRVDVQHSSEPVQLIRFEPEPFADRLVRKFALPVSGWRKGEAWDRGTGKAGGADPC
ncbi:MAG: NAD kinase [Bifidobacteriaceae bacterium]|nr:NAD kinase [Bifidobacteriaceae bacterium]